MKLKLYEYGLTINESRIHMKSDKKKAISEAIREIKHHRQELAHYVKRHPEFQYTLEPIEVSSDAPLSIRIMTEASKIAYVGPMACVAGVLADLGMEAMFRVGARTAVVEDGGEIAAYTLDQPVDISILSSYLDLSGKTGFYITREDCPLGIATSSSKTSHAISFGEADSATVVADNATLADAAATSVCNSVVGADIEKSIQQGLKRSMEIKGIRGAIISREGHVGLTGKLPKIISVKE